MPLILRRSKRVVSWWSQLLAFAASWHFHYQVVRGCTPNRFARMLVYINLSQCFLQCIAYKHTSYRDFVKIHVLTPITSIANPSLHFSRNKKGGLIFFTFFSCESFHMMKQSSRPLTGTSPNFANWSASYKSKMTQHCSVFFIIERL